jgi:hypothetical protein
MPEKDPSTGYPVQAHGTFEALATTPFAVAHAVLAGIAKATQCIGRAIDHAVVYGAPEQVDALDKLRQQNK